MSSNPANRKDANMKMIQETNSVQSATKDATARIKQQLNETEEIGNQTLEQLRAQGLQTKEIIAEAEGVSTKLDEAQKLQNTFDTWGGGIFGFGKRKAEKAASAEIALRQQEELMHVKEVFEQQKYDSMRATWKPFNMVLCSNPLCEAPELFVPSVQATIPNSTWQIDHSLSGIDGDGWTYAYDFNTLNKTGMGESTSKWNTYVRRRKWKNTGGGIGSNAKVQEIQQRHASRVGSGPKKTGPTQAEKIGYVSRTQVAGMKASGLVSAGMTGKGRGEELDDESASGLRNIERADADIDDDIHDISNAIDRIGALATNMNIETKNQMGGLEQLENTIQVASEKQATVNQRIKRQLKANS